MRYAMPFFAGAVLILAVNLTSLRAQDGLQPPRLQPNRTPTTSPYLLLGNNRNDPVLSYFRIVRPENQIRSAFNAQDNRIRQLRSQVENEQRELDQARSSGLSSTGHRAMFQNYGGFFGTNLRGPGLR